MNKEIFEVMRPMPVFKPELRKANRGGLKSVTRRVIDPQPISTTGFWMGLHWANDGHFRKGAIEHCPYGKAGDYCYMREPLVRGFGDVAYYKDDEVMVRHAVTGEPITWRWKKDVLTSIFMPKEAARSIYRYEDIRVERVQDISHDDAVAEGCYEQPGIAWGRLGYSILWNKINAERGFDWDSNPWVWVLKYKPVKFISPLSVGDKLFGYKANFVIFDEFKEVRDGDN